MTYPDTEQTGLQILSELGGGYESELEQQLSAERIQRMELDICQDEHPISVLEDVPLTEAQQFRKKLKRELRAEALSRKEEAARTEEDFREVTDLWDKLDLNRERREQYHEVSRGDVPLEYGAAQEPSIVPAWLSSPTQQAIRQGRFLDVIFKRPEELYQMVGHPKTAELLQELKPEYQELLFRLVVCGWASAQLAETISQSDRNVRKKKMRLVNRLRDDLYEGLSDKKNLSRRELQFLGEYEKAALSNSESGEKERCSI